MKTLIYTILFFLTLNSLYAQEVQDIKSADKESASSKITLTRLAFAKTDKIIPGITLDLTPVQEKYKKFQVTLAHNLFKSLGSSVEKESLIGTALYAQMNFRF